MVTAQKSTRSVFNLSKTEKHCPLVKADGKSWDSRQLRTGSNTGTEQLIMLNYFSLLEWVSP